MRIVVKKAGQMPEVREVENDLSVFQEIVGGYIECVNMTDDILCVCNEEGKLRGLAPNFILGGDLIVGDVFFCAFDGEDFASLEDHQAGALMISFIKLEKKKRSKN